MYLFPQNLTNVYQWWYYLLRTDMLDAVVSTCTWSYTQFAFGLLLKRLT